jgi:hypothetical protein
MIIALWRDIGESQKPRNPPLGQRSYATGECKWSKSLYQVYKCMRKMVSEMVVRKLHPLLTLDQSAPDVQLPLAIPYYKTYQP